MHDDTQVGRVVVMGRALRNGQFPVRWVADLGYGYGYPLFNFYGPLPYYVGGFLYMAGVSGVIATKIMLVLGMVLAGVSMYAFIASVLGIPAGILSGVLYLYAPYHAVQVFVRGAAGELWALAFLPLIAWGIFRKKAVIGSIGLAGVILSHTVLGYVTVLWYIAGLFMYSIYLLLKKRLQFSTSLAGRQVLNSQFSILFIGLSLSAFFWLPAAFEMRWTNVAGQIGPTANFRDHFVCPSQLWNSLWGFGGSVAGCVDGMSFKLGKLHLIVALLSLLVWVWKRTTPRKFMMLNIGVAAVSIFFMLKESQFLWEIVPFTSYIQYPWRYLTYTIAGLAAVGGAFVLLSRKSLFRWGIALVLSGIMIFVNAKWFMPQSTYQRSVSAFETDEELRFRVSKISDEYLPPSIKRPNSPQEVRKAAIVESPTYSIETDVDTEVYARLVVTSNNDTIVRIDRAYFPGWVYLVNGKLTPPTIIDGLPQLALVAGSSIIEMHFYNTFIRSLGNLISAVTLITLIYIYGKNKAKAIS